MSGLGFKVEHAGETLCAASATKMLRSIMIKGVEALFLECVAAASHFGATERVLNSLQPSLPGLDWPERARYLTSRTALPGARRAVEMTEAGRSDESRVGETCVSTWSSRWASGA